MAAARTAAGKGGISLLTQAPRGTHDVLPGEAGRWRFIEDVIRDHCRHYGYGEIRTPIFEHTELFARGVGETTDIVEKEMYTFHDRGGRSVTLRPEGTASVVRAFLEHGLQGEAQPTKFFYLSWPVFRYEKPQAGRYRQHHQFGVELFGSPEPGADAEVISLAHNLFRRLGLEEIEVQVNSIGCPQCRPWFRRALEDYYRPRLRGLCPDCAARLDRNPLRLLDCKREGCRELGREAPDVHAHLCGECREHFDLLCGFLGALGVPYQVNNRIVRGLDYYTRTVFEFIYSGLGAQDAVCSGGRYDGLIEACGGKPMPGIGFGLGMERLLALLEQKQFSFPCPPVATAFVATIGAESRPVGYRLLQDLRRGGVTADTDYLGRSLKGQMKHADRLGARFVIIIGEAELAAGTALVRDMAGGDQREIKLETVLGHLQAELAGDDPSRQGGESQDRGYRNE